MTGFQLPDVLEKAKAHKRHVVSERLCAIVWW
jgi:hypothetical protein